MLSKYFARLSQTFKDYWIVYVLDSIILLLCFPIGIDTFFTWKFWLVMVIQSFAISATSFAALKDKSLESLRVRPR